MSERAGRREGEGFVAEGVGPPLGGCAEGWRPDGLRYEGVGEGDGWGPTVRN
jgi:hypothetical protein